MRDNMDAYDDYHRQIATEAHGSKDLDPAREMDAALDLFMRTEYITLTAVLVNTDRAVAEEAFAAGWKARGER